MKRTKEPSPRLLIFLIGYAILICIYLYLMWKYEFIVGPILENKNTALLAFENGVLFQFLVLVLLRLLGGMLLAFPSAISPVLKAWKGNRYCEVYIRWSPTVFIVFLLLVPILGLAVDFKLPSRWYLFLMNGFTRNFCNIAIGYLIVPQFKTRETNKKCD